jgi:Tol biopolymer transport system component
MNRTPFVLTLLVSGTFVACAGEPSAEADAPADAAGAALVIGAGQPFADVPAETHLRNVRQLTFDGENAEAYFSFDGAHLTYQRTAPSTDGSTCDQIHTIDLATGATRLISTGQGRTTCSYYFPAGDRILYASTHHHDPACPARPDFSRGYVWPIYETYDLFVVNVDGSGLTQLTDTPGYDAEATISPRGDRMVFTSLRSGDLDLWTMNLDGSDARQITTGIGYDGGAFFSPDGSKIVWRAHYPQAPEEVADYQALLADGLIRPTTLEIYVANADGSEVRQVTSNGKANFGPYWHPSGEKILFASNMDDPAGRDFDIYMINVDGTGLERITHTPDFDGFPMFNPDGRYLVWGSNRNMSHDANTNVFIAEWVEGPSSAGAP